MVIPVFLGGITFIFFLKSSLSYILNIPLDGGCTLFGKPIFGKNKTLRGPLVMSVSTAFWGYIVYAIFYPSVMSPMQIVFRFALVGCAYHIGELPNSFVKRRFGIPPGSHPPKKPYQILTRIIDTTDGLFSVGVMYYFIFTFSLQSILVAVFVGIFLHQATDMLMVSLHLKK